MASVPGWEKVFKWRKIWYYNTHGTADFSQQVLPVGKVNLTGIVGDWNRFQPQNYFQDVVVVR